MLEKMVSNNQLIILIDIKKRPFVLFRLHLCHVLSLQYSDLTIDSSPPQALLTGGLFWLSSLPWVTWVASITNISYKNCLVPVWRNHDQPISKRGPSFKWITKWKSQNIINNRHASWWLRSWGVLFSSFLVLLIQKTLDWGQIN